jgi:hypothetical protein
MRLVLLTGIFVFTCSTSKALASDFLGMACEDAETKSYCMVLLQGFLTGYKIGHHNATSNASAVAGEKGPELCIPVDLTAGDIYEDMHPHLPQGVGFLDMSLFIAALSAYPCDEDKD